MNHLFCYKLVLDHQNYYFYTNYPLQLFKIHKNMRLNMLYLLLNY